MQESEIMRFSQRFSTEIFSRALDTVRGEDEPEKELIRIIETSLAFSLLEFGDLLSRDGKPLKMAKFVLGRVDSYFEEL